MSNVKRNEQSSPARNKHKRLVFNAFYFLVTLLVKQALVFFSISTHRAINPCPQMADPCIHAIFAWSGTTVSPRHNTFKEESSVRLADHGTSWIPLAGVLTAFLKTSADHWVVDGRAIGLFTTALWHNRDSHLHEDVWWRTAWGKSSESWKKYHKDKSEKEMLNLP